MRTLAPRLTLITTLSLLATAAPALGAGNGGTSAGATPSRSHGSSASPAAPAGAAPVTARRSSLAYHGPVYEVTPSGLAPYTPGQATAADSASTPSSTGGSAAGAPSGPAAGGAPELVVPGTLARYVNGLAAAPASAPAAVDQMIWAANGIIGRPYVYGGGHGSFTSEGYDCSGTVSFALHGASLIAQPMDSSEFMSWGQGGIGQWVTIFTNPGHAYVDIAGLRLDTSSADDPSHQDGPRWRPLRRQNTGFKVRHPASL